MVTNGRIVLAYSIPLNVTQGLLAEDFTLLESHAGSSQYGAAAAQLVSEALEEGHYDLSGPPTPV